MGGRVLEWISGRLAGVERSVFDLEAKTDSEVKKNVRLIKLRHAFTFP
jgi:hypothetical protein